MEKYPLIFPFYPFSCGTLILNYFVWYRWPYLMSDMALFCRHDNMSRSINWEHAVSFWPFQCGTSVVTPHCNLLFITIFTSYKSGIFQFKIDE